MEDKFWQHMSRSGGTFPLPLDVLFPNQLSARADIFTRHLTRTLCLFWWTLSTFTLSHRNNKLLFIFNSVWQLVHLATEWISPCSLAKSICLSIVAKWSDNSIALKSQPSHSAILKLPLEKGAEIFVVNFVVNYDLYIDLSNLLLNISSHIKHSLSVIFINISLNGAIVKIISSVMNATQRNVNTARPTVNKLPFFAVAPVYSR